MPEGDGVESFKIGLRILNISKRLFPFILKSITFCSMNGIGRLDFHLGPRLLGIKA